MCPYAYYYKPESHYKELIYCKRTSNMCGYSRMCSKLNKVMPNRMEVCTLAQLKNIPTDSNRVRFEKRGKLYIEVENTVIALSNPYDHVPDYVYVVAVGGEWYLKGYEPKIEAVTNETTNVEELIDNDKKLVKKDKK